MFSIDETALKGVKLVYPKVHYDSRGLFCKTFNTEFFHENGLNLDINEQYYSESSQHVIRGLHFQIPPYDQYKLVTCVSGRITDVIVDLRQSSSTYGLHIKIEMCSSQSVYIPPGFAHGFIVRRKAVLLYNVSTFSAEHDKGIHYDSVGIKWGIHRAVLSNLSERDKHLPRFADFVTPFIGDKYL